MNQFQDRSDAGKMLATQLAFLAQKKDAIILALPRGGVPIAYEISQALAIPFDIFIVRKLGVPTHPELAMGAITANGSTVLNQDVIDSLHISTAAINQVIQAEQAEINRRERVYRGDRPLPLLQDKTIILVDDGIATGATMCAAIKALRAQNPAQIIVAVPVAADTAAEKVAALVDQLICPLTPAEFHSVGAWYADFPQLTDAEVSAFLAR